MFCGVLLVSFLLKLSIGFREITVTRLLQSRACTHCCLCPHRTLTFREAMEDLVLLLVLLQTLMVQTSSLPYVADANSVCSSPERYITEGLCCSRCPPGHKMKIKCTETNDSVCEPCGPEQYMENWNFNPNCFSCIKCKASKGLQEEQSCSPTKRAKCVCGTDMFCIMKFNNGQCQNCASYKKCKKGFGVSVKGTATSDVICKKCPEGTFSDIVSSKEACKNHSICDERQIISKGNATSDTVCKAAASNSAAKPETSAIPVTQDHQRSKATTVKSQSFPNQISNYTSSTTELPNGENKQELLDTGPDKQLVIGSVAGVILLLIVVFLLVLCKRVFKKAPVDFTKVDANGNCNTDSDNTNLCEFRDTESFSFKAVQPEQQGLLENGDAYCFSNSNSNGPLQSTIPVYQPHSALSEPLPLQSNVDQVVSQIGTSLQSSSQPTSPQSIAPNPLVNVNINLHIGNGTYGSPAVMVRDTATAECKIPFGEEEESCSLLQQEDGKPSLLSVEESGSFNSMSSKTLD